MDRRVSILVAALCASGLAACASVDAGVRDAGGPTPLADTAEAGLWRVMDEREAEVRRSPLLNRSDALNAYVRDVMCRVSAEYCGDLRIYVLDRPEFNALMAPNGYSEVWAGLLLRAGSEDELAFVLAHEAGHFIENHSLERWRTMRRNTNLAGVLAIGAAAAGAPELGDLGRLAAYARIFAYSREHEREADAYGQRLAADAGYDPAAGARLWETLIAEQAASDQAEDRPARANIFATHPVSAERAADIRAGADAFGPRGNAPDRHLAMIAPHLDAWLDADIAERDFGASLALLDRLDGLGLRPGVIALHRGDVHRLRGGDGDEAAALAAYSAAVRAPDAPARAHRELGLMLRDSDDPAARAEAARALRDYLQAAPAAPDRAFIERYAETLESPS